MVQPGSPALADIAARFGPEVIDADGALDRKRLGAIVFADPGRARTLSALPTRVSQPPVAQILPSTWQTVPKW